jgi:hypothetical protein
MPTRRLKMPDIVTEILFRWYPAISYRWVADYTSSVPASKSELLNTIPQLTTYWNTALERAGETAVMGVLNPAMSEESWIAAFTNTILPVLKNNKKVVPL